MSRYASRSLLLLGLLAMPSLALVVGASDAVVDLGVRQVGGGERLVAARSAAADTVWTYETEHFFLVYSVAGVHKMVLHDANIAEGGLSNIEWIGLFAENAWRLAIDTMGYKPPLVAAETTWYYKKKIPKGKFPIEIVNMGSVSPTFRNQPYLGYSVYPTVDNGNAKGILLENDFVYDSSGVKKAIKMTVEPAYEGWPLTVMDYSTENYMPDGWATSVSHEFFHCVAMGYEYSYRFAFHEMSASWFAMRATRVYGSTYHWGLNQSFLTKLDWGAFADGDAASANALFIRALAKYAGDDFVRKLWESRAVDISSRALSSDRNWFRRTVDSLKLDISGFIGYYASEIGCMVVNAKCDLNDNHSYFSLLPEIRYTDPSFSDTTSDFLSLPGSGWGATWQGISKTALSRSVTRYRIEKYRDTLHEAGFILHLPSRTYESFSLKNGPVVVAERADDTLLVFWGVSAGGAGSGLSAYPTNAPVTAASTSHRPATWNRVKTRYDLRGRPLSGNKRGVYFERLENGDVRRNVGIK